MEKQYRCLHPLLEMSEWKKLLDTECDTHSDMGFQLHSIPRGKEWLNGKVMSLIN